MPPAVHLIDASYFVFRAYYSVGLEMTDGDGQPVNALYGFGRFLGDLLEEAKPEHVGGRLRRDRSSTLVPQRRSIPAYKANREPAPPELKRQFALCRELCRLIGLAEFSSPTHEADDIIGTIATRCARRAIARCSSRATRISRSSSATATTTGTTRASGALATATSRRSSACGRSAWRTTWR